MARDRHGGGPAASKPVVQRVAFLVAGVFLLLGVLGFVPGVTTGYEHLAGAGHTSGAKLFGLFQVSILHNALHLLFGLVGLVLARTVAGTRLFLGGGGAIYLVLWLYGFAIAFSAEHSPVNFIPVNGPDNWLHLGLGFGMLATGLLLSHQVGNGEPLDTPPDRP